MSDELFDPAPYIKPGATPRRTRAVPPPAAPIRNDGSWITLARLNRRPAQYAHQMDPEGGDDGGDQTLCGLRGRPVYIEPGAEVIPCPRCRASDALPDELLWVGRPGPA